MDAFGGDQMRPSFPKFKRRQFLTFTMVPEATTNGHTVISSTPTVRAKITDAELDQLFTYGLRCNSVFRHYNEKGLENLIRSQQTHYQVLWATARQLAMQQSDGNLPQNLRQQLEVELHTRGDLSAPVGELLNHVFESSQDEIESSKERGIELLCRLDHQVRVFQPIKQYISECNGDVPTKESLELLLQGASDALEQTRKQESGFGLISSRDFAEMDCTHNWLVKQILVEKQPAIIGGPKKCLKTSVCLDLALSLAIGSPSARFLNRFEVEQPRRVGMYSGESGKATIQESANRICATKRRGLRDVSVYWGFKLPHLSTKNDLQALAADIRRRNLEVVILDPLYLCLLSGNSGASASNLFDIGPLLSDVADVVLAAGATPILVHHTVKSRNSSYNPLGLEDLAFAGIQEFARQWMLIGRREAYDNEMGQHKLWMSVGGSAGFSGCFAVDVTEGRITNEFNGRQWRVAVRPQSAQIEFDAAIRNEENSRRNLARHETERQEVIDVLRRYPNGETLTTIRDSCDCRKNRVEPILQELVQQQIVEVTQVSKPGGRGNREYPGYKLVGNRITATRSESTDECHSTNCETQPVCEATDEAVATGDGRDGEEMVEPN